MPNKTISRTSSGGNLLHPIDQASGEKEHQGLVQVKENKINSNSNSNNNKDISNGNNNSKSITTNPQHNPIFSKV